MALFEVSYDLRKPGRNYQSLYDRLAAWGAFRVLESVWIINSNSSAVAIRDDLLKQIDSGDGLLVTQISAAAWNNLDGESGERLKKSF